MTLLADSAAVAGFCDRQAGADFIAVDTEFMRERTYWSRLCLLQIAGPTEAVAIDTLAPGLDLAPVVALFDNPAVLKVFHAARQDIEIFVHLTGRVPAPLFDTQVAAMVCGFGDAVSYETLAAKLAGARIDKSSRFTDWSRRPLSERQLHYALSDVTHLRLAYEKLKQRLERSDRTPWLSEEMAILTDTATYRAEPRQMWRRLKVRSSNRRLLSVLRELAAWRENEAQTRDLPRGHVLRDEALLEIASHMPRNVEDLAQTRGLGRGLAVGAQGAAILAAVECGLAVPESEWPEPVQRPDLPSGLAPLTDLLRVLLKTKCEAAGVAQRLVASGDDLQLIAADDAASVPALHGWRHGLFGADALALKHGRLSLTVAEGSVRIVPLGAGE
jgi:ribonuclease D